MIVIHIQCRRSSPSIDFLPLRLLSSSGFAVCGPVIINAIVIWCLIIHITGRKLLLLVVLQRCLIIRIVCLVLLVFVYLSRGGIALSVLHATPANVLPI